MDDQEAEIAELRSNVDTLRLAVLHLLADMKESRSLTIGVLEASQHSITRDEEKRKDAFAAIKEALENMRERELRVLELLGPQEQDDDERHPDPQ